MHARDRCATARRRRAVLSCERLYARGAKELPVHADQERGGDARVTGIDPFLLERVGERLREVAMTSSSFARSACESSSVRAKATNLGWRDARIRRPEGV